MKHLDILITGNLKTHAYAFRLMKRADELGIKGFAQYLDQNRIHLEVEAESEILELFVSYCKDGIPKVRIDSMDISESKVKDYHNFTITNSENNILKRKS